VVQIEYSETFERKMPKPGGLSDPRLGTIDSKVKCETCSACHGGVPWSLWASGASQTHVPYWLSEDCSFNSSLRLFQLLTYPCR
jgi:DNA-directed RNA polymerase beta' subunit